MLGAGKRGGGGQEKALEKALEIRKWKRQQRLPRQGRHGGPTRETKDTTPNAPTTLPLSLCLPSPPLSLSYTATLAIPSVREWRIDLNESKRYAH